jgi:hypothetical protein
MEREFFRIVCIDESDPMEYKILEDSNKGDLDEVHNFVKENYEKHKKQGVRWLLLQAKAKM